MPDADKHVEQQDPFIIAGRNGKWYNLLKDSLPVCCKTKHTVKIRQTIRDS